METCFGRKSSNLIQQRPHLETNSRYNSTRRNLSLNNLTPPIEILQYQRARLLAAKSRVIEVSTGCGGVTSSTVSLLDSIESSTGVFMT